MNIIPNIIDVYIPPTTIPSITHNCYSTYGAYSATTSTFNYATSGMYTNTGTISSNNYELMFTQMHDMQKVIDELKERVILLEEELDLLRNRRIIIRKQR